jgi:hypothetical protein
VQANAAWKSSSRDKARILAGFDDACQVLGKRRSQLSIVKIARRFAPTAAFIVRRPEHTGMKRLLLILLRGSPRTEVTSERELCVPKIVLCGILCSLGCFS